MKLNVPNALSGFRLALIPLFCWMFILGNSNYRYYYLAGLCLALSGLSDLFDGYFARKLNQETALGKWLDPTADKLTLGAVVGCMWLRFADAIPALHILFSLLFLKEVVMAAGGIFIFRKKKLEILPSRWWGKIGT
ncbi:MAG: CDP-alcohol phosphatidyltransferase family protein, partial [Oscillospiraceae bacterium]|nr:CDP-alcohol phosphatidyltransferase family protein [Oscillospiraceae bacterium]